MKEVGETEGSIAFGINVTSLHSLAISSSARNSMFFVLPPFKLSVSLSVTDDLLTARFSLARTMTCLLEFAHTLLPRLSSSMWAKVVNSSRLFACVVVDTCHESLNGAKHCLLAHQLASLQPLVSPVYLAVLLSQGSDISHSVLLDVALSIVSCITPGHDVQVFILLETIAKLVTAKFQIDCTALIAYYKSFYLSFGQSSELIVDQSLSKVGFILIALIA